MHSLIEMYIALIPRHRIESILILRPYSTAGNQFHVKTVLPNNYEEVVVVPRRQRFTFGVEGHSDAVITFSNVPTVVDKDTVKVVIGSADNQQCEMRDNAKVSPC